MLNYYDGFWLGMAFGFMVAFVIVAGTFSVCQRRGFRGFRSTLHQR